MSNINFVAKIMEKKKVERNVKKNVEDKESLNQPTKNELWPRP